MGRGKGRDKCRILPPYGGESCAGAWRSWRQGQGRADGRAVPGVAPRAPAGYGSRSRAIKEDMDASRGGAARAQEGRQGMQGGTGTQQANFIYMLLLVL